MIFLVFITMQEDGFIFQVLSCLKFCLQNQEKSNKFQSPIEIIGITAKLLIPQKC